MPTFDTPEPISVIPPDRRRRPPHHRERPSRHGGRGATERPRPAVRRDRRREDRCRVRRWRAPDQGPTALASATRFAATACRSTCGSRCPPAPCCAARPGWRRCAPRDAGRVPLQDRRRRHHRGRGDGRDRAHHGYRRGPRRPHRRHLGHPQRQRRHPHRRGRGELQVKSANGKISVGRADGSVVATTANGDIHLDDVAGGRSSPRRRSARWRSAFAPGSPLGSTCTPASARSATSSTPVGVPGRARARSRCGPAAPSATSPSAAPVSTSGARARPDGPRTMSHDTGKR